MCWTLVLYPDFFSFTIKSEAIRNNVQVWLMLTEYTASLPWSQTLQPVFVLSLPPCFSEQTSLYAACYGRIRAERHPGCIRTCSFGSHLSLGAWEGMPRDAWLHVSASMLSPHSQNRAGRLQINMIWTLTSVDTKQAMESLCSNAKQLPGRSSEEGRDGLGTSLLPHLTNGFQANFVPSVEGVRGVCATLTAMISSLHFSYI